MRAYSRWASPRKSRNCAALGVERASRRAAKVDAQGAPSETPHRPVGAHGEMNRIVLPDSRKSREPLRHWISIAISLDKLDWFLPPSFMPLLDIRNLTVTFATRRGASRRLAPPRHDNAGSDPGARSSYAFVFSAAGHTE